MIAEAMNGFGKTAAVLAGALSAAEEMGCKVSTPAGRNGR